MSNQISSATEPLPVEQVTAAQAKAAEPKAGQSGQTIQTPKTAEPAQTSKTPTDTVRSATHQRQSFRKRRKLTRKP